MSKVPNTPSIFTGPTYYDPPNQNHDHEQHETHKKDLYKRQTLGGVIPNPLLSKVREGIELCQKEHVDFSLAVGLSLIHI